MNIIYLGFIAFFAAGGCEEDILLIPDRVGVDGNSYSAVRSFSNLWDKSYASYWSAKPSSGWVTIYFRFSTKVTLKEVFLQRYYNYASQVYVDAHSDAPGWSQHAHFPSALYSTLTFPGDSIQTTYIKIRIYHSSRIRMSSVYVHGCYNTTTPTTVPTSGPTELPTVFPTLSPTLPPVTTYPTKTPSIAPTTAPTGSPSYFPSVAPTRSPSVDTPSTYPSAAPTWSPTKSPSHTEPPSPFPSKSPSLSPSPKSPSSPPSPIPSKSPSSPPSPIPSKSPSSSPTVVYTDRSFHVTIGQMEFLVIVVVFLCGVIILLFRRYNKVLRDTDTSQKAQESQLQIVQSCDIEDAITRIVAKNGVNRKADLDKTTYNEGENSYPENFKRSDHRDGEEKNRRFESQVPSDHTGDFRFALDKVNSEI